MQSHPLDLQTLSFDALESLLHDMLRVDHPSPTLRQVIDTIFDELERRATSTQHHVAAINADDEARGETQFTRSPPEDGYDF